MRSSLAGWEYVPKMLQPRDARWTAIARPMPRLAPVMTATLPVRSCWRIELCGRKWVGGMMMGASVGVRVNGD